MPSAMKVPKAMERISVIVDAFEDAALSCLNVRDPNHGSWWYEMRSQH